jgi:hypothetical protein
MFFAQAQFVGEREGERGVAFKWSLIFLHPLPSKSLCKK